MTSVGFFLCGCKIPDDAREDSISRICGIHGQREYGWRSASVERYDEKGGRMPPGVDIDRVKLLFSIPATEGDTNYAGTVADTRDNRDPASVGRALLARRRSRKKSKTTTAKVKRK